MCRRLFFLFSFVLVLGPVANVFAYFGDDFESYTATGTEPYEPNDMRYTWDPTGTASDGTNKYYYLTADYIHGGLKALKLWFDNSFSPHFCGVSRTDPPSDWTINGAAAGLSLWFRGAPNIDQMYVRITDSSDREAVVKYSDAWDPNDLVLVQWQQWDIILRYFTENNASFDMTAVKTFEIGIGEPNNPAPGVPGGGIAYFDDIELYKCLYQSQIDLNGDCVVDWRDVFIFADDWLDQGGAAQVDMDFDGGVNFGDYSIIAKSWLDEPQEFVQQGHSGIASNYTNDVGIESNPRVILFEDFETRDIGTLTTYWSSMRNNNALTISSEIPPSSLGSRSLQITANRNPSNNGGSIAKSFPSKYDELYARFYVKFAYDYGFNHHFCKLGTVMGGGAGQLPTDRFWTGLEPVTELSHFYPSTEYPPPGFWHFYTYWPHMKSWQTPEGEPDGRDNPYYGNDFSPRVPTFTPRDEWICVEYMMRANSDTTDPENCDGVQRFWINGQLIGNWAPGTPIGYWYRATFRLDPADPRSGPFEGYRWRDFPSVGLQYFKVENYVTETAFQSSEDYKNANPGFIINDQQATCWFDHIVVATSYIGPIHE
ncbi:MAG: hypothetical protein ACYS1A_12470 [Planctomycetota bacterium]